VHPEGVGDLGAGCGERTAPARREEGDAAGDGRAPCVEPATALLGTPTTSGCTGRKGGHHFPFDRRDASPYTAPAVNCHVTITSPARRTATRSSFLGRLKNWADQKSWRQFIAVYGCVIRASAMKAGLRSEEADDVVQETLLSVARSIPGFVYDRSKGTFEAWVRRIAQCRVADHLRQRGAPGHPLDYFPGQAEFSDRTDPSRLSHSVDPFAERWETAWRESALLAGMERLKHSTSIAHYQIFHMIADGIEPGMPGPGPGGAHP
jgi:DNA-directed RNA polymerase specialized sigma24 family protein